jgi:hypothetical protein
MSTDYDLRHEDFQASYLQFDVIDVSKPLPERARNGPINFTSVIMRIKLLKK